MADQADTGSMEERSIQIGDTFMAKTILEINIAGGFDALSAPVGQGSAQPRGLTSGDRNLDDALLMQKLKKGNKP